MPRTMTRLLHDYDSSFFQRMAGIHQDSLQSIDHVGRPRVVQAKQDYAYPAATRERDNLTEVQIEGQNNSLLGYRLFEYLAVWHSLEPLVAKVNRIVSLGTQPFDNPLSNSHICEESHL